MNYALVNKETAVVESIIVWDGITEWTPPDNMEPIQLSKSDVVYVGGTRNPDGTFNPPALEE